MSESIKLMVVVQKWEESELGWGVRPDGYSLHLTDEDRCAFIRDYWARMPKDHVPDEYSREDGSPYMVEVDAQVYGLVKASKNGIRRCAQAPGDGGTDGSTPVR